MSIKNLPDNFEETVQTENKSIINHPKELDETHFRHEKND